MIFISLCLVQQVRAETKYVPQIVPKCTVLEIYPGVKRCVYTLDDVKALYEIDTELVKLQNISALQGQKLRLQSDIISWQQEQLKLNIENTNLFHNRMNSLTKLYVDTDKKLQIELEKPRWGHYIAWGLVVAVTTLFTGYVVADQIAK